MADEQLWPVAPRTIGPLIGHSTAEKTLAQAWTSGQMPNAWLISGPKGIGKASLAYTFASLILKSEGGDLFGDAPVGLDVAPDDPVSAMVINSTHPDLVVVQRTINEKTNRMREEIVIGDARKASGLFARTSSAGGWRVVIIDAADELNKNAANALLKLVEEPPEKAVVLLVAHRPGRVLLTLRSRCRHLRLGALSSDQVADVLAAHHADTDTTATSSAALATLAEGSPGQALRLASVDGLTLHGEMLEILADLPAMDIPAQHKFADRMARGGNTETYRVFSELLLGWMTRLIQTGAGHPPAMAPPGEADLSARLLPRRSLDQWVGLWENVTEDLAKGQGLNLDRKQVVLNLFSTLQIALSE
jgi:DNA polymerase-3 subunit delta'